MAFPALLSGVEAIHDGREAASPATTSPACGAGHRPAAARPWRRDPVALASHRRQALPPLPAPPLKFAAAVVVAPLIVMPVAVAYVGSHAARTEVPAAQLGTAYEDVTLQTSDGLELEGWYVPRKTARR